MTGIDEWHGWLAWMTFMDDFPNFTYWLHTYGRTLVLVKSLSRLKISKMITIKKKVGKTVLLRPFDWQTDLAKDGQWWYNATFLKRINKSWIRTRLSCFNVKPNLSFIIKQAEELKSCERVRMKNKMFEGFCRQMDEQTNWQMNKHLWLLSCFRDWKYCIGA